MPAFMISKIFLMKIFYRRLSVSLTVFTADLLQIKVWGLSRNINFVLKMIIFGTLKYSRTPLAREL